ncbi:unnamed protein product [Acanthoscelides obtectus]|uniref:MADF domain-containing protein n=1 Tax=Acanthoscelides obtectus TaxID=200917 RepID=A0A9P0LRS4_ACAOB|nr:unnamed protein product [Acanthoscelides obtectus]CAK1650145.1 hypothetical protein AOBTE_LOCUS16633 [Acanthoscelides obtectus]
MYGSKELLWNSKSRFYHDKALREDAWREIRAEIGVSVPELKKKMTVLLSSYRREKWRLSKSQITGSGRDSIYVSKWFSFDDFSFMQDKLTPNDTTDTMQEPTSHNEGESSQGTPEETLQQNNEENIAGWSDNMNEQSKEVDTSKVPEKPAKKNAKKRKHDEEENEMLTEAFKILTETSQATDPYFSYGQHIANELRKYDNHTLIYVKQPINHVIFEADLGKYRPTYQYTTQQET